MGDFQGQVAWITGGSGDIACATAERLIKLGAKVILFSRNRERLQKICEEFGAKGYLGKIDFLVGDAMDYQHCEKIVKDIVEKHGSIDILICTQGIQAHRPIDELTLKEWQDIIDVNLTSVFYAVKAAVPYMKTQSYGRIVLLSSLGGRRGRPGVGVNYAASKAGLVGMTQSLAYELGPWNITVNCVAPGPVATKMLMEWPQEHIEKLMEGTRIHRLGTVEEIAAAIAYLACKEAGWTTGEVLDVNGGLQY